MLATLPVASMTTSARRPSVSRPSASMSLAVPSARIVSATAILDRTNSSRGAAVSITITRAPESLANSTADRPIGPAPITSTVSAGVGPPRSTAWQPIASVSTSAFCAWERRGEGWSFRAGSA